MSQLKERFDAKIKSAKDEVEKKIRSVIGGNSGLVYSELEIQFQIKSRKQIGKQSGAIKDEVAHQIKTLNIEDPGVHFIQLSSDPEGHAQILESLTSSDDLKLECKEDISKVLSEHVLRVCPEAVPSVAGPFFKEYLANLSELIDPEEFYKFTRNGTRTGSVYRLIRCVTRPSKAGKKSSTPKTPIEQDSPFPDSFIQSFWSSLFKEKDNSESSESYVDVNVNLLQPIRRTKNVAEGNFFDVTCDIVNILTNGALPPWVLKVLLKKCFIKFIICW